MKHLLRSMIALAALVLGAMPAFAAPPPMPDAIPVAMLVDTSTGQTLYAREVDRRFVPASVTKVMTAYTAFVMVNGGKLPLRQQFTYTQELQDEWYGEGSNMFLLAGERPTIGQLLLGVTTVSGNDASVALAHAAAGSLEEWLALMNANAARLGMTNTHFGSPNGYPDGGRTYTTARDLAVLGTDLTRRFPDLYQRFFGHRQLTWRTLTQRNHDPVTGQVEGADGIKTGYTSEAGYTFLGSAAREGRRLVLVLAGAPGTQVRDEAARAMLEWGFSEFQPKMIFPAGHLVGTAQVQDGAQASVGLQVPEDLFASLPREGEVSLSISYRGPIAAPIMAGDTIARLRVSIDGEQALEVPLEAAETVAKANLFQRIANAFSNWFA